MEMYPSRGFKDFLTSNSKDHSENEQGYNRAPDIPADTLLYKDGSRIEISRNLK